MIQLRETTPKNFDLKLDKSFDFECHHDFRSAIKKISETKAKTLTIDFDNVEYIDSSALGMLMLARHEAENNGCDIELYNLKEGHTKNVLSLVKFDKMFKIRAS